MKKFGRGVKIVFITLLVLVAIRVALPYAVRHYLNWVLQHKIEGYTGHVEDVDLALWRGAYEIEGLHLLRVEEKIPVPFIKIGQIDFAIAWKPLWRGHVVGKVKIDEGVVNFVSAPTEAESQTGAEGKGWQGALDSLFPLDIEELQMTRSQVHFMDLHTKPKVDVYLKELELTATNLGNTQDEKKDLVSDLNVNAKIQESGKLEIKSKTNILKTPVAFDGSLSLTNMQLPKLNDFLEAYGNFNVKTGQLDVFAEAASIDGKIKGYVKPFLTNVDVVQIGERFKTLGNLGSELGVGTVNLLIRRYSKDQLATKVPFEGNLGAPNVSVWTAIKTLFRHAFGKEVKPKVDNTVDIKDPKKLKTR